MILLVECLIGIILFTIIVVPMSVISAKDIIRKAVAIIVLVALAVFVMLKVNHAETFLQGFGYSMVIWLAITWFDALVLDCIWFCHSKRMRIPGTEDMKEYKDYLFHIKQSCIGTLIGLPACALIGLLVMLFAR